ncbi:MAG: hypothetical protein PWR20_1523 [Bacteroidales bacterium]|nr:hypothetical protein [Bacteroidales bacterium]MDN5330519.1 hypothetical protein [Bacteroidales bacterium]
MVMQKLVRMNIKLSLLLGIEKVFYESVIPFKIKWQKYYFIYSSFIST